MICGWDKRVSATIQNWVLTTVFVLIPYNLKFGLEILSCVPFSTILTPLVFLIV